MAPFKKPQFDFGLRGIHLNLPPDNLPQGYVPYALNVRRHSDGSVCPRHGLGTGRQVIGGADPVHSVRRLNDSSTGTTSSTLIVGAGTSLGICGTDLASSSSSDTGFSGDPLSICIHRPNQSTKPHAYVADRSRMRKIDVSGADKQIGLPPPVAPPSVVLSQPQYKVLDEMNAAASWTQGGTAAAPANNTRVDAATRSITAILYDSGTTGWCCVRPSSMADIGEGTRLTIAAAETVTVEDVFRGAASTTIEAITYEGAGGPGICSIHLVIPVEDIDVDSMVLLTGTVSGAAAEYVRVRSVHRTPDGYTSFRCSTAGGTSFAPGDTVLVVPSFRCYTTVNRAAGNSLGAATVQFQVTEGKGWIQQTIALDLSVIAAGVPTRPDDFMHIDIYSDNPELISEVKLLADINNGTANFEENYLQHVIRSNDFTPLTVDEQTLISSIRTRNQRKLLDDDYDGSMFESGSEMAFRERQSDPELMAERERLAEEREQAIRDRQMATGQNQYTSIKFRISELLMPDSGKIGTDMTRGLANVAALRIVVIATGTVTVRVDGWWIGGGFGPDVSPAGRNRIYRYRGRDSTTGVVSNWSPALFGGIRPKRQKAVVSLPQHPSTEADKLDVAIYGGEILGWHFAGSVDNGVAATFDDTYSDEELSFRDALTDGNVNYQLWPQERPPNTGTNANISGNLVTVGGFGSIDTSTAPGTGFRCNGKDYTIHQVLSANKFYIAESGGSEFAASWEISKPLILAQPMPVMAGPFFNFYFGLGDKYNPWRLYYTNGNDPDSTKDTHWIDVEGEILQNIVILEGAGRAILFTTERAYSVEPAFTLANTGGGLFAVREIPGSVGLWSRWACVDTGGEAAYLSKDGIHATDGAGDRHISHELRPIFPRGSQMGTTTNSIVPPNMTAANAPRFRLGYSNRELCFDYIDTGGAMKTLVNERSGGGEWLGWLPRTYGASGARIHYGEEGENVLGTLVGAQNGSLYRLADDVGDDGGSFVATVQTPHFHDGDPWTEKHHGDGRLDYDRDGATITVIPAFDHRVTVLATTTINSGAGRTQQTIDLGTDRRGKNISLEISATVTTERPVLYFWRYAMSDLPDTSLLRAEDYEVKQAGVTYAFGVWIYVDTFGVDRAAEFEYTKEDGTKASIAIPTINHATLCERYYPFETPVYLNASRVRPTDADSWKFATHRVEGVPAPPKTTGPTDWILKGPGARYVQGVKFHVDTENVAVDVACIVDQEVTQTTINAATNDGPVQANGRAVLHHTFDEPFITHLLKFNPSAAWRVFGIEIVDEPEPELAHTWWTQQFDFGVKGYKFLGDGYVTVRSTAAFTLVIVADGVEHTVTFEESTNTAGARRKLRFRCPSIKAKSFEFKLISSTDSGRVAVYQKEFQLEWKPWSHEGGWLTANPLGDMHFESGARI